MELQYKVYRKVKIYFNKISGALPNLEALLEVSALTFGGALVASRIKEMELMQAQLVGFFMNPELRIPYVPDSRCLSVIKCYSEVTLISCANLSAFNSALLKEDNKILQEANYIVGDPFLPLKLKEIFKNHIQRLENIQITKETLKSI